MRDVVEAATRVAFANIIDAALSHEVTALLIAGDLFDGKERSARTGAFLITQLDRLREKGIRVFYIKGNHDAENPITGTLELPDNVHVFDASNKKIQLTEDIWIHGVSFSNPHMPDSLLPKFSAPDSAVVNIAMLHTSLGGAEGHGNYAPCALSELKDMGFDYWALGHIHKRQIHSQSPWVVMPGMPQGRDIGEAGPKSASLLTISDGKINVEEVPTSVVEFCASSLDVTGMESDDGLRDLLRDHLRVKAEALKCNAGVLRLTLYGSPMQYWQIHRDHDYWSVQATELAKETGRLWIDKLILNLDAPKAEDSAVSPIEELSRIMGTIQGETGFTKDIRAEVNGVIGDFPPAIRARLLPDEAAAENLADDLAKAGALGVLAQMKGGEA